MFDRELVRLVGASAVGFDILPPAKRYSCYLIASRQIEVALQAQNIRIEVEPLLEKDC